MVKGKHGQSNCTSLTFAAISLIDPKSRNEQFCKAAGLLMARICRYFMPVGSALKGGF